MRLTRNMVLLIVVPMMLIALAATAFALAPRSQAAPGHSCQGAYNTASNTCSATIQGAIDAAHAGDMIMVAPGVYNEDLTIPAGKDGLTLRSRHGAGDTMIVAHSLGANAPYSAVVDIASNHVTLGGPHAGFTLTYSSDVAQAQQTQLFGVNIGANGNVGTITDVTVQGNVITNLAATGSPLPAFGRVVGIAVTESANTAVRDNTFSNISFTTAATTTNVYGYAILYYGTNTGAVVSENTIDDLSETGGSTCPGEGALAIALNDHLTGGSIVGNQIERVSSSCLAAGISTSAASGAVTIEKNTVERITSGVNYGAAIALKSAGALITVSKNVIQGSVSGVAISTPLPTGSGINSNTISGNGVGVYNASNSSVDATLNWWGCETGPNTSGCDSIMNVGTASTTAYSPWLQHPIHA